MAKRLLVAGILLVAFSCSKEKISKELVLKNSNIMNGVNVVSGDVVKKHVVALIDTEFNSICTGTVIAENLIMTAAHCAPTNPHNLKIVFHEDAYGMLETREQDYYQEYIRTASKFIPHENYDDTSEEYENIDDIAILKFSGSLPEGYSPVRLLSQKEQLRRGQNLIVAGYGVDEVVSSEIDPFSYPDLAEAIESGIVFCEEEFENCIEVLSYGDGTLRKAEAPIDSFTKNEFVLNETKAGTCNGDSGGPAFAKRGNELILAGVTSRGGILCNDEGVYTNVARYENWVKKTVALLK